MNQISANQFADELHQRTIERRRSDRNRKFWGITAIVASGAAALGSVILIANSREHDVTKLDIEKVVDCAVPAASVDAYGEPVVLANETVERATAIAVGSVSDCQQSTNIDLGPKFGTAVDEVLARAGVVIKKDD